MQSLGLDALSGRQAEGSDSDSSGDSGDQGSTLSELIQAGCQSSAVHKVKRGAVSVHDADPKTGYTYLHQAAWHGREVVAIALIKAGANVHAVDKNFETALHVSCKWPHEKCVEVLLKSGANPNALNKRGRTPVHTASHFARRGALELLVHAGGGVNGLDNNNDSPLHLAARNGSSNSNEVVRLLLKSRCLLDIKNNDGKFPLDFIQNTQALVIQAAMEGLPDLMTAVIKKGGVKLDVLDASGMSPLQTAAFKGDMAVARALIAGGAKVNFQAPPVWSPCPSLAAAADSPSLLSPPSSASTNTKALGDRSPLHFAAERGSVAMMELLLAHGAKVNNTSNEGFISPLHIAVWNQQAEAVRMLLSHKADIKARVNRNGMAPLHFACNSPAAKLETISMLLDAKADIEERCSDGLTPLMLAAQMAPADAVRLLLVRGARVQAKGRRGMTALDCAEGRHDILGVLVQHCAARGLVEMAARANAAAQRAARHLVSKAATLPAPPTTPGTGSAHPLSQPVLLPASASGVEPHKARGASSRKTSKTRSRATAATALHNGAGGSTVTITDVTQGDVTAASTGAGGSTMPSTAGAVPAPVGNGGTVLVASSSVVPQVSTGKRSRESTLPVAANDMAAGKGTASAFADPVINQLRSQLSHTSAQLYAWATAATAVAPGGPSTTSTNTSSAHLATSLASASASSRANIAAAFAAALPANGRNGSLSSSSVTAATALPLKIAGALQVAGAGGALGLQQMLSSYRLPSSLADMGSSPILPSGAPNPHKSVNLPALLDLAGQQGGGKVSAAGAATSSCTTMDALSEAVHVLSCITAIVTQQADFSAPRPPRTEVRSHRRAPVSGAALPPPSAPSTSTTTPPGSAAAAGAATDPPVGHCAMQQLPGHPPGLLACLPCECAAAPGTGGLGAGEHQLLLECSAGCVFRFHLACWKVAREQLRSERPGLSSFSATQSPGLCLGCACSAPITHVAMVGPAGTRTLFKAAVVADENSDGNVPTLAAIAAAAAVPVVQGNRLTTPPPIDLAMAPPSGHLLPVPNNTRHGQQFPSLHMPAGPGEIHPVLLPPPPPNALQSNKQVTITITSSGSTITSGHIKPQRLSSLNSPMVTTARINIPGQNSFNGSPIASQNQSQSSGGLLLPPADEAVGSGAEGVRRRRRTARSVGVAAPPQPPPGEGSGAGASGGETLQGCNPPARTVLRTGAGAGGGSSAFPPSASNCDVPPGLPFSVAEYLTQHAERGQALQQKAAQLAADCVQAAMEARVEAQAQAQQGSSSEGLVLHPLAPALSQLPQPQSHPPPIELRPPPLVADLAPVRAPASPPAGPQPWQVLEQLVVAGGSRWSATGQSPAAHHPASTPGGSPFVDRSLLPVMDLNLEDSFDEDEEETADEDTGCCGAPLLEDTSLVHSLAGAPPSLSLGAREVQRKSMDGDTLLDSLDSDLDFAQTAAEGGGSSYAEEVLAGLGAAFPAAFNVTTRLQDPPYYDQNGQPLSAAHSAFVAEGIARAAAKAGLTSSLSAGGTTNGLTVHSKAAETPVPSQSSKSSRDTGPHTAAVGEAPVVVASALNTRPSAGPGMQIDEGSRVQAAAQAHLLATPVYRCVQDNGANAQLEGAVQTDLPAGAHRESLLTGKDTGEQSQTDQVESHGVSSATKSCTWTKNEPQDVVYGDESHRNLHGWRGVESTTLPPLSAALDTPSPSHCPAIKGVVTHISQDSQGGTVITLSTGVQGQSFAIGDSLLLLPIIPS